MKFLAVMGFISLIGFLITLQQTLKYYSIGNTVIRCLDLITISVPPSLPAAMSIGVIFALARIKKGKIFCISPPRINVAGRVKMMVFDKTGTLTEDGLKFAGLTIPSDQNCFHDLEVSTAGLNNAYKDWYEGEADIENSLLEIKTLECMATCHGIAHVHNQFIGDPLDVEMFKATTWTLDDRIRKNELCSFYAGFMGKTNPRSYNINGNNKNERLSVVKRFDFASDLQRMSVIVKNNKTGSYTLYTKGSPEMMAKLSNDDTIPENFYFTLEKYTAEGYRVLAFAYKDLDEIDPETIPALKREEVERNLNFLGLMIMENKTKVATKPCINMLQEADISTIMATGDNGLTAVAVGRH